jgi:hypothetical protein
LIFDRFFQTKKEEKVFAKRGSILGSLTASISEALSSASITNPAATAPSSSDPVDSIFMAIKRKGSLMSGAIFQSSEGGGDLLRFPTFCASHADVQIRTQAFGRVCRICSKEHLKLSVIEQVRAGAGYIGRHVVKGKRLRIIRR